ncbi:MAG: glycoside hydrolase family 2 TIM barrel-domain containing protein [Paludibacter sp.]|nr:glycoside hydrolase family 2 TIM barrel-domain containing protein [Paludibacter sp.]
MIINKKLSKLNFVISNKGTVLALFCLLFLLPTGYSKAQDNVPSNLTNTNGEIWSKQKAKMWYNQQPWLSGCNYQTSTAVNQIEMWQAETFDPKTIDKQLGWAHELGFNTMRVYLSSVVWKNDPASFKKRINKYLSISSKHQIRTILVFFDDCWNEESALGKQPVPKPGVHNSGWVQDPSSSLRRDTLTLFPLLENYIKDILVTFKNDKRILLWDLYNEPGNSDHGNTSIPLLKNVFKWARQINPSQPVSSGVWCFGCTEISTCQASNSDIITYHNYGNEINQQTCIDILKVHERPMICTEYMARKRDSRFENIMPLLKKNNIGAINWGFVSGKTNTIFAWDAPEPNKKEPLIWFHDILRQDKTPFDQNEIDFIKKMNGK